MRLSLAKGTSSLTMMCWQHSRLCSDNLCRIRHAAGGGLKREQLLLDGIVKRYRDLV